MISPMRKGATAPAIDFFLVDDDGNIVSLAGVASTSITVSFYNVETQIETPGQGTVLIIGDGSTGEFKYNWAIPDTSIPGRYEVRVSIVTASGILKPDPDLVVIKN